MTVTLIPKAFGMSKGHAGGPHALCPSYYALLNNIQQKRKVISFLLLQTSQDPYQTYLYSLLHKNNKSYLCIYLWLQPFFHQHSYCIQDLLPINSPPFIFKIICEFHTHRTIRIVCHSDLFGIFLALPIHSQKDSRCKSSLKVAPTRQAGMTLKN